MLCADQERCCVLANALQRCRVFAALAIEYRHSVADAQAKYATDVTRLIASKLQLQSGFEFFADE